MKWNYSLHRFSLAAVGAMVVSAAGVISGPALAADSSSAGAPPPAMVQQAVTGVATVETIDRTTRQILLSDPSGNYLTITAGPGVRNLAQLHAGDQVEVTYQEAVAAQVAPPGSNVSAPSGESGAVRAARGELPAGAAYSVVRATVRVDAVDNANHTVTVTGANGVAHTILVRRPAMQEFASQLKPGDNVQIEYLQAVTIKTNKMQP